jgi:hypothetical protein
MTAEARPLSDLSDVGGVNARPVSWRIAIIVVGALALAAGLAVVDRLPVGAFHDDAMYVILAKSIATGQGYRYLNLPGAPGATHFPPGYPALLAAMWRLAPGFPANLVLFKALNAIFLCASAVLVTRLARERLGSAPWALSVGFLTAVSVPLLVLGTMVLSEPLFLALLLLALLVGERLVERPSARAALGLGLLIGLLTLVRTHGIVVLPAILLPVALRRRWRECALLLGGAVIVVLPWQLWSASNAGLLPAPLAGNYGSYVGWWLRGLRETGMSMIPATVARTVPETSAMLTALFSPWRSALAHLVTTVSLVALLVTGALVLRRRAPVVLCFLVGYAAIVMLWPFPPSRFVWGVWPLLLFMLCAAGWRLTSSPFSRRPYLRVVLAGMLCWVAVGYASYEVRAVRGKWWASISRAAGRRIGPAVEWTLTHTAPADVVASDDEGSVYLYTGRRAVPVASFTTGHYLTDRSAITEANEGLVPLLVAYPIRVVLVGSSRTFDAAQSLAAGPRPLLSLRQQFDGGAAFTVLPQ